MSRLAKNSLTTAFVAVFLSLCGVAFGDEYHYVNTIVGERPSGMAGAYTAVADDATGTYYNPAGIIFTASSKIQASINTFQATTKTYQGALGSTDYSRTSSTLVPNFVGFIQLTPYGTFGFSIVVPDSKLEQQAQTLNSPDANTAYRTINWNNQMSVLNAGPSLALDVTKNLKFGVTFYIHKKNISTIKSDLQKLSAAGLATLGLASNYTQPFVWTNAYYTLEEFGTRPILGLLWEPEEAKYSVGLTASQTFIYTASQYQQTFIGAPAGAYFYPIKTPASIPTYPLQVKAGAAYFPTNSLLISFDVSYNTSADSDAVVNQWSRGQIINYAMGVEYYPSSSFALRGGFYTDYSNTTQQALNASQATDNVDITGYCLSGTWFSKNSSLSLGVNYGAGNGQGNISGTTAPMSYQSLTAFLGTSYNY
jgi:long-chain fatty acid transport protein